MKLSSRAGSTRLPNTKRPDSKSAQKTVREFSAGGVVLKKIRGDWHIAVIEPETRNNDPEDRADITPGAKLKPKPLIHALPKGAIDAGERAAEAAAREVFEETGVRVNRIAKLADIKYFYIKSWGGRERVFKVVSFYLFRYRSGRLGDIADAMRIEVRRTHWMPLHEAPKKLSYKGEREVANLALEYVKAHPEL
jgi:ADP-ribose pyrophosphatase YjhB (NUDIX family)